MPKSFMRALTKKALFAACVLFTTSAAVSQAAPPQHTTQVPGFYRQALGSFTVTALYDGYIDLDPKLLKGISASRVQALVARMFIAHSKGVQTAVNAYLVHTGEQLLLVDAGAGHCFGPTLGKMIDNIRAAGYTPEDVDAVLLTHLHPDHICGLTASDGRRVFPKAVVWAPQEDADFWLSEQAKAAAPAEMQPFFTMAQTAMAPYQTANAVRRFAADAQIAPGVKVVSTHGHTPGHSSFLLTQGTSQLLVWGDIVHNHAVQFAHPAVSIEFDTDAKRAIAARSGVFARAAKEAWWVAGAHLPFPGIGHVRSEGKAYTWVPTEYGPIRQDR